jgi:hypothetical protein
MKPGGETGSEGQRAVEILCHQFGKVAAFQHSTLFSRGGPEQMPAM